MRTRLPGLRLGNFDVLIDNDGTDPIRVNEGSVS
jgi:hypothetical protein